jgi:anaerobic magnesium-protoporphyrin IX monomethyl ester cyclase
MRVLFVNVPNVTFRNNKIHTGPNGGSCWPWVMEGASFHNYAPFPINMAYAVSYLQHHGIEAELYDAVAEKHADLNIVRQRILDYRPSIAVFEAQTPVYPLVNEIAAWTKNTIESKIVLMGQHVRAYADECVAQPHIDHCIVNEPEIPILDIVQRYPVGDAVYRGQFLKQIDTLPDGNNFLPYRDFNKLGGYYDPSIDTERTQVWLNASRSCPWGCCYCTLAAKSEGVTYRARKAEFVVDELKQIKARLGNSLGSFWYDDDTWGLGAQRIRDICKGHKELGVPFVVMTRIDSLPLDVYDDMVDSCCVGMRFGVETFNQTVLNNTGKKLDAKITYDNLVYLLKRFKNIKFHLTTMQNLPGWVPQDWVNDQKVLRELQGIGGRNGNRVQWQNSSTMPLPSTIMWQDLIQLGHGDKLKNWKMFDGHPDNDAILAREVGWLGTDYKEKLSCNKK